MNGRERTFSEREPNGHEQVVYGADGIRNPSLNHVCARCNSPKCRRSHVLQPITKWRPNSSCFAVRAAKQYKIFLVAHRNNICSIRYKTHRLTLKTVLRKSVALPHAWMFPFQKPGLVADHGEDAEDRRLEQVTVVVEPQAPGAATSLPGDQGSHRKQAALRGQRPTGDPPSVRLAWGAIRNWERFGHRTASPAPPSG